MGEYEPARITNDAFRSVSKYWDRVTRPKQLMSTMLNAMRVLTNPAENGAVKIAEPEKEVYAMTGDGRSIGKRKHPESI
ncbi:hypothetical protein [Neobacillus ginsengisoli]|uniref:TPP-dependent trihydroxycyclohexane-1,2-dione (THcHDO) dehydratase n=1 Tax=Neobacillus ginsengisoli TaxID=904295 RepID=A0ABT9XXK3_9BACI|nr:hypothetical protein [Neobacillus ginsengisoli]MDQ0200273.1 TPP-dependent trihydroxycyclohexane-1,2-dione (THcHDO) dehydratase [Neobacillus ginsengisoli]